MSTIVDVSPTKGLAICTLSRYLTRGDMHVTIVKTLGYVLL